VHEQEAREGFLASLEALVEEVAGVSPGGLGALVRAPAREERLRLHEPVHARQEGVRVVVLEPALEEGAGAPRYLQLLEPPRRLLVHRGEILVRVRKVTRARLDGTHELAELRELPVGARHDGAQARRRALVLVENIAELLRARGRHRARRARGTN
jgi:hypothetical protein